MTVARQAVTVGANAAELRRQVGPMQWCVLEVLAASAVEQHGDDAPRARGSVRSVAIALGVSKNAVQRALLVLSQRELVIPSQRRHDDGNFGPGTYTRALSPDVLEAVVQYAPSSQLVKMPRPSRAQALRPGRSEEFRRVPEDRPRSRSQ